MDRLFKYLPEAYVDNLLDGEVLFRNLVYFKKIEADPRRDSAEGAHIDAPDHDVTLTIVSTGRRIVGRFAYHNTLERMDRVFCFCTSLRLSPVLQKFGTACIRIEEPQEFARRLELALRRRARIVPLHEPLLTAGLVTYYRVNEAAPAHVDIKNPVQLPFLKRDAYSDECEYRFVFARRDGFRLKQMIVNERYVEAEEVANLAEKQVVLKVGSIRDIARRIVLGSAASAA